MKHIDRYLNIHLFFEIAPLVFFLVAYQNWGLIPSTFVIMGATAVFSLLGFYIEHKIPVFPLVTLVIVLVLGGATIIFENETFIKIKPTIGNAFFALTLIIGLRFQPSILARALEGRVFLSKKGWQALTIRWVVFALSLAIANEVVWRTQSTDFWVAFKSALTPVSIIGYIGITRFTAPTYWQEPENLTKP